MGEAKTKLLFVSGAAAVLLHSVTAAGAPSGLTYQGRIVQPNGLALESANVQFTVQIKSPGAEACTLYEETHTLNLTSSDGVFSINVGSGTRGGADTGLTLSQVFTNTGTRSGLACASGNSYTPASSDARNMYVSFNDGSGLVSFSSPYVIRSVPYALEAQAIAGFGAANLCRIADAGVPQSVSALTSANFTELMSLVNGTSSQYTKASTAAGTSLAVVNGNPASPASGSVWLDSLSGNLKFHDGTTTKTVGTSGGSVTSITAGTGLSGGTITTSGTIAVDVGTAAGKIVQLNGSAELPAVSGANLTSLNATNISGGTLDAARLPTGVVTAGTYRSVTVDTTGRVTGGSNPTTIAGYGLTDAVQKGGQAGALIVGTSDANSLTLNTSNSARMTILSDGKVGIGTISPQQKLQVSGGGISLDQNKSLWLKGPTDAYWRLGYNHGGLTHNFLTESIDLTVGATNSGFSIGSNGTTAKFEVDGGTGKTYIGGNLGVGTTSPQSTLQVNGYVQLALTGGAPPATDCDAAAERGRMKVDNAAGLLYICMDSGWVSK